MDALARNFAAIRDKARLQIPRRVDYGLRAIIYLSVREREKCYSITEIAKEQEIPRQFWEKIIQDLIRYGLTKSKPATEDADETLLYLCTFVSLRWGPNWL